MLKEVKVRVTRRDKQDAEKEVTEWEPAVIQTDNITGVIQGGAPGVLAISMLDGKSYMAKETIKGLLKK